MTSGVWFASITPTDGREVEYGQPGHTIHSTTETHYNPVSPGWSNRLSDSQRYITPTRDHHPPGHDQTDPRRHVRRRQRRLTTVNTTIRFTLLVLSAATPGLIHAQTGESAAVNEVGLRTATGDGVNTAEAYVRWPAQFVQEHVLEPYLPAGGTARWEAALSYWKGDDDHAVVFMLGPSVEYPLPADHWRLSFGIQPTLLSDYESDNRSLGGPFEFTSHIGLRWQPEADWYLGARIQHTSNAGIYDTNPGVDLFAVELGGRF